MLCRSRVRLFRRTEISEREDCLNIEKPSELRRIACNYAEPTKTAAKGSLAFVLLANAGNAHECLFVLSRSRSGRWIEKWEALRRLTNFRRKTVPAESPLYAKLVDGCDDRALDSIRRRSRRPALKSEKDS